MKNFKPEPTLVEKAKELLEEQKISWPLLQDNYLRLENVKTNTFQFEGYSIIAQCNPERIISSSAQTSKKAIEVRPCFLCEDNLPKEQGVLSYNSNFNILCNPYPIFKQHYTITSTRHEPQTIKTNFVELLSLAEMFEGNFSVLYNGPNCGASAPDHMHFQAVTANKMPVEYELQNLEQLFTVKYFVIEETEFRFINDAVRKFVVLKSFDKINTAKAFFHFYNSFVEVSGFTEEPLMNVISYYKEKKWHVIIFPRRKHRPTQYFAEGQDRFLISPAVVDLGGLLILPREEDFNRITSKIITNIFRQVMIDEDNFKSLIEKNESLRLNN